MNISRSIAVAATLALAAGALAAPVSAGPGEDLDAVEYCESVGGEAQERKATWNSNADPADWVDLGNTMWVCRFQADDEAQSRIYVEVSTLYSEEPNLAAGAYLAQVPVPDGAPGNPATFYCADLAGSSQFGTGASGGGWVNEDDPIDVVVAMCVFPDGSAIDDWGITYHSDGTVRGTDLTPLFRSDTENYPPFFG